MDHGIVADASLSPAERAVKYTLDVLKTRPGLAWFLVGTETLCQLLSAEAHRRGLSGEEVTAFTRDYAANLDRRDPCEIRRIACPVCDVTLTECPSCGVDVNLKEWEVWHE